MGRTAGAGSVLPALLAAIIFGLILVGLSPASAACSFNFWFDSVPNGFVEKHQAIQVNMTK